MRSIRYRKKTHKRSYKKKQTHKRSYKKKQTNKRSYKKKQTNKRKTHKRNNKRNKLKNKNLKQFGGAGWDGSSIPKTGDMASALLVEADGRTPIYGRDLINCNVLEVDLPGKKIEVRLGPMKIDGMSRQYMIKTYTFDEAYEIMRPYGEKKKPADWRMQVNPGEVFMDRQEKGDPFEAALERRKRPMASPSDKREPFHNTLLPEQKSLLELEGTAGGERSSMRSSAGGSTDSSEGGSTDSSAGGSTDSSAGGSTDSSAGGRMSSSAGDDGGEQVLDGRRKMINDELIKLLESEDIEDISMALRENAGGSPLPAWSKLQERLKLLLKRDGVDEGGGEGVRIEDIKAISSALRSNPEESQMQQPRNSRITVRRIPESQTMAGMTRSVTPGKEKQSPRERELARNSRITVHRIPESQTMAGMTRSVTPWKEKQSPRERGLAYDEERRSRNLGDQATWKTVQRGLERDQREGGGQGMSPSYLSDTEDLFGDPFEGDRRKAATRVRSYRETQRELTQAADSSKSSRDLQRAYDKKRREQEAADAAAEAAARRLRPRKPLKRMGGYSQERQETRRPLSPGGRAYQKLRPPREEEGEISARKGFLRLRPTRPD